MEPEIFCQSCTMPIDDVSDRGTEKDGSKSDEFCKYCYQHGTYTDPAMSLQKMEEIVKNRMQKMHLPKDILQRSLGMLLHLKRWQKADV
jgi:hypothetical protein